MKLLLLVNNDVLGKYHAIAIGLIDNFTETVVDGARFVVSIK